MFETPTTWIGALVALGLIAERFYDRWARRRDVRAYQNGVDRRQHNNGNPNGLTKLATRLDGRINTVKADLVAYQVEQRAEWAAQRVRDGEMHDKINGVDRAVGRLEGRLGAPGAGQ